MKRRSISVGYKNGMLADLGWIPGFDDASPREECPSNHIQPLHPLPRLHSLHVPHVVARGPSSIRTMESLEASQPRPIGCLWVAFQRRHQVCASSRANICFVYLPSRRLLDYKTQERYYTNIIERYMAFCSDAGKSDELLRRLARLEISQEDARDEKRPHTSPSPANAGSAPINFDVAGQKDLSAVTMAIRKLREGIVASKRVDDFSVQAYIFCIRFSILVKHMESYHPAVLFLLQKMHHVKPLAKVELQEFVGYLVLDLACRQNDLAKAYAVRNKYRLHDAKVDQVLHALAHDDYILFWRVKKSVDGYKAKLMEWAEEGMIRQTLKSIGRSYMSIDLLSLEWLTNSSWSSLVEHFSVGWELEDREVTVGKPKSR